MSAHRFLGLAVLALALCGCRTKLPDADSPGARLYAERCNTCHRVFAPGSLKFEMWKFQVERMQGELRRRGLPMLTEEEKRILLDYLAKHSMP